METCPYCHNAPEICNCIDKPPCPPMTDKEKLKYLMSLEIIKLEGWAGVLPNGNIADRREHPKAIPMQKNTLLGIPEPRPLLSSQNTTIHLPLNCQKCGGDGYVVRIVRGPESQAGVAEDCECQSSQNAINQ